MNCFTRIIIASITISRFSTAAHSQTNVLELIEDRFHQQTNLSEKIFVHTDKNFYLVGEIIWFKLYYVDGSFHKPLDVSKVAYVEILDKDQKPVLQCKIALSDGSGNGSLFIPSSLTSGAYRLRAYTNWMKNFDAEFYFEKPLTIVNPFKDPNAPPAPSRDFDIYFFPEGGDLVQGLRSKVAFKIVDQFGAGIDGKGILVNSNNDTIVKFEPVKFGIGNFSFTPVTGDTYTAIVKLSDTIITRHLPKPLEQGYVMKVDKAGESQLHVSLLTNIKVADSIYLFVHTRGVPKMEERRAIVNGSGEFMIDKNKLGAGISQITIFNSGKQPVCERLFFAQPTQKLIIEPVASQEKFSPRQRVNIAITCTDELKKAVSADMSMSIYRIDSLQTVEGAAIDNYFWLTSDLKGNVETPEYYFSTSNSEVEEAADNLMLTHGWRRFTWQNILQTAKPVYDFTPEFKGHIISGKVTDTKTGVPASDIVAYLSVPGTRVQLYGAKSDSRGAIRFYTKDFFGPNEIILQTDTRKDTVYGLEINNPFSRKLSLRNFPSFNPSHVVTKQLLDNSISVQVQDDFAAEQLKQFYAPLIDSGAFFGNPDNQYLLDDYTRFSTMEEVLREYVYEVLVRRQRENFRFIMADGANKIFMNDPLTLVNGVPIFDPNKVIKYDPLKVKKIELVKRKYFYGSLVMNGIVNFITYKPDASLLSDLNATISEYEGLQYQRQFYSPSYDRPEQVASRLPDFRNVLFWSPNVHTNAQGKAQISFFTSDLKGRYVATLQGMSADGSTGEKIIWFEVK